MPAYQRLGSTLLLPVMIASLLATQLLFAPSASAATRAEKERHASRIARNQIGDPYVYGAEGPNAFDCSGLIYYSYRKAGFSRTPRTSQQQANWTRHIKKRNMRRGDLMFFYDSGGVYHVAIFLRWRDGHAVMVHSPRPGGHVRKAAPWTDHWFAGTKRKRG